MSTTAPPVRRGAAATSILLVINILVYVVVEWNGGPTYENLVLFGAKENGLIASGEWYRLVAPIFLHAGLMHLGFNMWALYQVGRVLEYMIGPRNFVVLYFVGGITSTLCSFALSPAMSVGASGCLYAVLLALFVLQRYEEQLAKTLGLDIPRSPLGMLIVLNGLITFVIPNVDWAAHLGGALAGALLGMAIIMRHRWRMRLDRCRPFLDPHSPLPHRRLWEIPNAYVWLLALINLGFSLGYFRVTPLDRSFGQGMMRAAEIREAKREPSQLGQFGKLITAPQSETNPQMLAAVAVTLHKRGLYLPAFLTYHGLLLMVESQRGTMAETEVLTLHGLMESAYSSEASNPVLDPVIEIPDVIGSAAHAELAGRLAAAAELLGQLRFFGVAAKFSEASFLLASNRLEYATASFAFLKKEDDLGDVFRFRDVAKSLMTPNVDPALAPPGTDPNRAAALRAQGLKSIQDFHPASMWTLRREGQDGRGPQNQPQERPLATPEFQPPI